MHGRLAGVTYPKEGPGMEHISTSRPELSSPLVLWLSIGMHYIEDTGLHGGGRGAMREQRVK